MPTQWYSVRCGGPQVRGLDDGTFEVAGVGVPVVSINSRVAGYATSIWKWAVQYGVPPQIVAGVMMRESGGNQRALAPDGGVGLMQITYPPLKEGHSDQELLDNADLNIQIGAKLLGKLWASYGGNPIAVLTSYNAGSVKCGGNNPWNLINTQDYVGGTLAMVNGAVQSGKFRPGADPNRGPGQEVVPELVDETDPYGETAPIAAKAAVPFLVGVALGASAYLWFAKSRQSKQFATAFAKATSW